MYLRERSGSQLSDLSIENCDIRFSFCERQRVSKMGKQNRICRMAYWVSELSNSFTIGFNLGNHTNFLTDSTRVTTVKLKVNVHGLGRADLPDRHGHAGGWKFQSNSLGLTQGLWNHWEEDGNRSNSCEELAFPSFASYDHCTDPQNEEGRDIWRLFSRRLLNLGPMHP